MGKKKKSSKRELRSVRIQQIFLISIGVLIILSMVLALVAK